MNKVRVFISSRVNSALHGLDKPYALQDLRKFLQGRLDRATFLNQEILQVLINEASFDESFTKDAFDSCITTMRSSNVIIILYTGEAGWSTGKGTAANGICHEEFLVAMNEFSDMSYMINLEGFVNVSLTGAVGLRNRAFANDVSQAYRHSVSIKAKTILDLEKQVLQQIEQYLLSALQKSFATQKKLVASSSVFGPTLDWSKLNYSERHHALKDVLSATINELESFNDVIKEFHAVPDNMSVSDARNRIGRPFLYEHLLLQEQEKTMGAVHFIAVYGNVSEIQAKTLVGYPDITVIKSPFGYYLWEKNMHIQIFFLKNCINPQTIRTRYTEIVNWLASSREEEKILRRAQARCSILAAINNEKDVS